MLEALQFWVADIALGQKGILGIPDLMPGDYMVQYRDGSFRIFKKHIFNEQFYMTERVTDSDQANADRTN